MLSLIERFIPWLNVEQLNILNLKYDYLFIFMMFIFVCFLNKIMLPILRWLMKRKYLTVLSYFMTSTLILVIFYTFSYKINIPMEYIKFVFYAIIMFGIYLTTLLTYKIFKKEM